MPRILRRSLTVMVMLLSGIDLSLIAVHAADDKTPAAEQPKNFRGQGLAKAVAKDAGAAGKRPATPAGKLLDRLAEQNGGNTRFQEPWCTTIMEIVDLGPDAVPDLIAELDATNDNMMLRCMGFTLRAIDDKRAVPALIRAIPKTLLPAGSDMGLSANNMKIVRFMQKHDLDEEDNGTQFGFGRPVREIFGAIQKLTGKSFEDEELFHIFTEGTANQKRMKKQLFDQFARKWAAWWDEHSSEFVKDEAYLHVNLPEAVDDSDKYEFVPNQHFKTVGGGSNWILEPFTTPKARLVFYDFDTGRARGLPKKWQHDDAIEATPEEVEAWALEEGFDLMGRNYISPDDNESYYAFRPIGLEVWELAENRWKEEFPDVTFEELQREGIPTKEWLLHFDPEKKKVDPQNIATFFFKTRNERPDCFMWVSKSSTTH